MDLGEDCPILIASCHPAPDWTLGCFIDRAHEFLAEFTGLHPGFSNLKLIGLSARDCPRLEKDLSNLRDWMLQRAWDPEAPSPYSGRGPRGEPTPQMRGSLGFSFSVDNDRRWDSKIGLSIACFGSDIFDPVINLTLARKDHPEFQSGPLPMQLLALLVKHWPVQVASFGLQGWNTVVTYSLPPDQDKTSVRAGWLTYFDNPDLVQQLPSVYAVHPVGPGVALQLTPHMARWDDEADLMLGRRLKAAIDEIEVLQRKPVGLGRKPSASVPTG